MSVGLLVLLASLPGASRASVGYVMLTPNCAVVRAVGGGAR